MKRALLCLLFLFAASCGPSLISGPVSVAPIPGVGMDTALLNAGDDPSIFSGENGELYSIGQDARGLHVLSFSLVLSPRWQKHLALSEQDGLEVSGVHADKDRVYVPLLSSHSDDVREHWLLAFDRTTGDSLPATTLLRLNRGDIGELPNEFFANTLTRGEHTVQPNWSPDSSKILLFKKYGAGEGRISIELSLYKRGYTLIARTNIDLKLDTNKQDLISIQPDNDGVVYITMRDIQESTLEVGRFDLIGTRKLKTIKQALPQAASGRIAVGSRGHVYAAIATRVADSSLCKLIDFDFYQNSAREITVASLADLDRSAPPPSLFVVPSKDRLIVAYEGVEHANVKPKEYLFAYDLDVTPTWRIVNELPTKLESRDTYSASSAIVGGALASLQLDNDTLRYRTTDLTTGTTTSIPLAKISGVLHPSIERVVRSNKQLYVWLGRLYRFTLP